MILLALSPCLFYPNPERPVFSPKTLCYLENDMGKYVYRKGVIPVMIPQLDSQSLVELMDSMHGLLLQAGSDMSPESYGEEFLDQEKWPGDFQRDQIEFELLKVAFEKKMPVLGICRGIQVINAFLGGTLYQDLGNSGKINHRDPVLYDRNHHSAQFVDGGILSKIYGGLTSVEINTCHHQAVKDLGKELVVEAVCPEDGIIEAIRNQNMDEHYVLGVQWHPEFSATLGEKIIPAEPLMDSFLEECFKFKEAEEV